ncbi:C6 zinc finger domain-containing protein [Ilyonectria destructans]|nr:C6 zinc finger domain-containing protein [Ilyonectria destructans]
MDGLSVGLDSRPTARRRIYRVKTGCGTCKVRRIKCDEQRPSCQRCTSAGRECKGYGIGRSVRLPGRPTDQCLNVYRVGNSGPVGSLSAGDLRVLEWFMLANLQGVFPFPFWETLVPQACCSEPAILSCVLALGSIHRRACIDKTSTNTQSEVENLESATLRYYNTAINLLSGLQSGGLQSGGSRASTRVTLTACLMFIIIEYLRKNLAHGLLHLQHGLQILATYKYNNLQPSCDPVDDWLVEAFNRLDVQSELFFNITTDCKSYLDTRTTKERVVTLRSLHEARQQLDLLISEACRLQRQGRVVESSVDVSQLFRALTIQQRIQGDLNSWLQAYRAWRISSPQSSHQPPPSTKEQVAPRLLLIYHTMASIMTATALYSGDESAFDRYDLQFASIIDSSKKALQVFKPVTSSRGLSYGHCTKHYTFTSDMGLIPVLYFTALKCRDPRIRRDALSMLATETRQEGIWEGPIAALIAAEVIRLEEGPYHEQGASHDQVITNRRCDSIPSSSPFHQLWRVSDVRVELPQSPEIELVFVCRRKLGDGTWTVVERRYNGLYWY